MESSRGPWRVCTVLGSIPSHGSRNGRKRGNVNVRQPKHSSNQRDAGDIR